MLPTGNARDRARLGRPTHLTNAAVPHEERLPDIPITLVVQSHADAGSLVVECDVLAPDGNRRVYGRTRTALAVIVRAADGILVSGLPAVAETSPEFPPSSHR
jgi:hypothetical protein